MQHGYWQQRRGSADIRYVSNISSKEERFLSSWLTWWYQLPM
jgi:hypothetical protein